MPEIVDETDFSKVSRAFPDAAKIVPFNGGHLVFAYHSEYLRWKGE